MIAHYDMHQRSICLNHLVVDDQDDDEVRMLAQRFGHHRDPQRTAEAILDRRPAGLGLVGAQELSAAVK